MNSITVDLEEWYHVCAPGRQLLDVREPRRVGFAADRILELLAEYDVKATFFVLGTVAADEPELIRRIAAEGHEVASHGWSHSLLHELTPEQFREELSRTAGLLEELSGSRPIGFRAPQWSVSARTPWAHDILAEMGYRYDSSMNPLPLIGNRNGSMVPFSIGTAGGAIREIPPMVTPTMFGNMPTGGGWGFRFFPARMIMRTIDRLNCSGHPAVIYIHPREFDPGGPRLPLSPLAAFAAYGTRADALPRVRRLLEKFTFKPLRELLPA